MGLPTKILIIALMAVSCVIIVCGLGSVGAGVKVILEYNTGKHMKLIAMGVGGIMCFLGVFICITGMLGICTGFSANSNAMKRFVGTVVCMMIVQVVIIIVAAVLWKKESGRIPDAVKEGAESDKAENREEAMTVQRLFKCCGGYDIREWKGRNSETCCPNKPPCPMKDVIITPCKEVIASGNHVGKYVGIGVFFLLVQLSSVAIAILLIIPTKSAQEA